MRRRRRHTFFDVCGDKMRGVRAVIAGAEKTCPDVRRLAGELSRFVAPARFAGEQLREIELHNRRVRMAGVGKRGRKVGECCAEFALARGRVAAVAECEREIVMRERRRLAFFAPMGLGESERLTIHL
jgi:hypothetical protein